MPSADSNCDFGALCASSEGSGKSAHSHRLAWAFVSVPRSHVLAQTVFWCNLCVQRRLWQVCILAHSLTVPSLMLWLKGVFCAMYVFFLTVLSEPIIMFWVKWRFQRHINTSSEGFTIQYTILTINHFISLRSYKHDI